MDKVFFSKPTIWEWVSRVFDNNFMIMYLSLYIAGGGFVGCFKDAETDDQPRDLPLWVHTGNDNLITKCIQLCTLKGNSFDVCRKNLIFLCSIQYLPKKFDNLAFYS